MLFLFIVLITSELLFAQKTIINQNLYWLRYYNQIAINKKLTWHNELEERRFFENNKSNHSITHSRLHYKITPNLDVAFGLTYSSQNAQNPSSATILKIPEIRPVQEVNYIIPISKKLALQQRLRIDERFIKVNDGNELQNGYNFNFRFRFRFEFIYKLTNDSIKNQTTLKIANELMINAGKNIVYDYFDQNRIYFAIQQGISKSLALEFGYLKLNQHKASGNQFLKKDILRLSLYHRLVL